ncbi:terminal uridylyltransferase 7-like [Styela clava]
MHKIRQHYSRLGCYVRKKYSSNMFLQGYCVKHNINPATVKTYARVLHLDEAVENKSPLCAGNEHKKKVDRQNCFPEFKSRASYKTTTELPNRIQKKSESLKGNVDLINILRNRRTSHVSGTVNSRNESLNNYLLPKRLNSLLSQSCQHVFKVNCPSNHSLKQRQKVCEDLELFLRSECHYDVRLHLFGSSGNGFTFHKSDIDICLVLDEVENIMPSRQFLITILELLEMYSGLTSVRTIFSAKVPIIKFLTSDGYEGDISLNNPLALRNTALLTSYAKIDVRCRILGYMFKEFVKTKFVKNTSSYAYIMLVIYFLQKCNPPVLPVLQELYDGDFQPEHVVDGWNAWFFDDMKALPTRWTGYNLNKQSIGELWFELIRFYSEIFDLDNDVVCIRKNGIMKKKAKQQHIKFLYSTTGKLNTKRIFHNSKWGGRSLVVEDPFDHGHNLTSNVSMAKFKTVIDSANRLHTAMARDPFFLNYIPKIRNAHLFYLQEWTSHKLN